ncbi:hypothetical protein JCM6882_006551 [Rhodosporidiobolus microsporus]
MTSAEAEAREPSSSTTFPLETGAAPVESHEVGADGVTNSQKNKLNHRNAWPYGNYRAYYTFRPASSSADASSLPTPDELEGRLALLDPSLFRDKNLLDLGTNAGKIPLDALQHFGAKSVTGVDIDPLLIEDSKVVARERGIEDDDVRCRFFAGDFMRPEWLAEFVQQQAEPFDVVTLFSVTKWLHLHNGDEGMERLYRSLYALLPPGGVVVIEPQEWDNYKRAVKKNKDLRETFKALKMRPPFEDEMKVAGFSLETRIEREEGGFSRPLLVWRKEA